MRKLINTQNLLNKLWYTDTPYKYFLLPAAKLYESIAKYRKNYYQKKSKNKTQFPVPVIVIGNITIGGTGKTPLTIWLTNFLKQNGYKPGIVSRGYGGKSFIYPQAVIADSDPAVVGDEPILIARQTHCPLVVDPNRVNAVETLLKNNNCNIVISDDGLQHYKLQRDIEILVIDGEKRFGNNLCIPAGPLREPSSRCSNVDFIIANGKSETGEYQMVLSAEIIYNIAHPNQTKPVVEFVGKIVHAVAGIGNPTRFFQSLRQMGMTIVEHVSLIIIILLRKILILDQKQW